MAAKKSPKVAPEFTRTRDFIRRYTSIADHYLDIVTVWMMTTWCFSPACESPATMPYLYITGQKGSGKTVLGQDVAGMICRNHTPTVGITGPGVFRIIGDYDPETGQVISNAPTLALDEIDATFSGAKDEALRQMLNAGYRRGAMVPRAAGKTVINYPVHCPKIMMGIENGHLPDTVLDRSIRIPMHRATPEQMATLEPFYVFDAEDEGAEISQELSDWAKDHSMVLRDYRPTAIPGLSPRQWEIARTLVQIAHEIGNEEQIREALAVAMAETKPQGKDRLYQAIFDLFEDLDTDRVTTKQIMAQLQAYDVHVPGDSGKGLSAVLSEEGIAPNYIKLPKGHPGNRHGEEKADTQRGYFLRMFDTAFVKYLKDEEE